MKNTDKTEIFESTPMPTAVAKLCIPTVLATLVMVLVKMFRRLQNERGLQNV